MNPGTEFTFIMFGGIAGPDKSSAGFDMSWMRVERSSMVEASVFSWNPSEDWQLTPDESQFSMPIKWTNKESQAVNVHSVIRLNTRIKASSGDAGKRWWPPGVG